MSDLISRSALIKELELYEKELRSDREVAIETDDEHMLFAIMNQETAICRIRRNVLHMPIAYDKEAVVEQLEEKTEFLKYCTKYGNKNAKHQEKSYSTMIMYEVAELVDDLIDTIKVGGIDG